MQTAETPIGYLNQIYELCDAVNFSSHNQMREAIEGAAEIAATALAQFQPPASQPTEWVEAMAEEILHNHVDAHCFLNTACVDAAISALVEMYLAGQQAASPVPPVVYVVRADSGDIYGIFQDQDAARRFCDGGPFSITNYEVHITSPIQQDNKQIKNLRRQLNEANTRLFDGRNYLMGVQSKKITVEDALEAFGFGRSGLDPHRQ